MSYQHIGTIGDEQMLKRSCKNVIELDLSKNSLHSWDEVRKLLHTLAELRFLNLSHNDFTEAAPLSDESAYFGTWSEFKQLRILILNACFIGVHTLEKLLEKLTSLSELHLCSNNYTTFELSPHFRKHSLHILYVSNNCISEWSELLKLGYAFPSLETLVISHNNIREFSEEPSSFYEEDFVETSNERLLHTPQCFGQLKQLIMNKLPIDSWSTIDQLRLQFPQLKSVRVQNLPLLDAYTDEQKYFMLVSHLDNQQQYLNGSEITPKERENCERQFIRYYSERDEKPKRYYELEAKHGKVNRLAEVRLAARNAVYVKIKFDSKHVFENLDVRMTVGEFKKKLEEFVGARADRFRIYYIDVEAYHILGPEEMRHANRCLHSFNIHDGDEFEIDLKPESGAGGSGNASRKSSAEVPAYLRTAATKKATSSARPIAARPSAKATKSSTLEPKKD